MSGNFSLIFMITNCREILKKDWFVVWPSFCFNYDKSEWQSEPPSRWHELCYQDCSKVQKYSENIIIIVTYFCSGLKKKQTMNQIKLDSYCVQLKLSLVCKVGEVILTRHSKLLFKYTINAGFIVNLTKIGIFIFFAMLVLLKRFPRKCQNSCIATIIVQKHGHNIN